MTSQEIHINLDLELQKINSFNTRELYPEEKDYFLNKEVLKYINRKSNKSSDIKQLGFQEVIKRVLDIDELLKHESLNIEENDEGKFINLPSDFYSFISSQVNIAKDCNKVYKTEIKKINFFIFDNNIENILKLENYSIQVFFNSGFSIKLFDLVDLPNNYINTNYKVVQQKFLLLKAIEIIINKNLKQINKKSSLYKEFYNGNLYSDKFIFETLEDDIKNVVVKLNSSIFTYSKQVKNLKTFVESFKPVSIDIANQEYIFDMLNSSLSKPSFNRVLGELQRNILKLYLPNGAIGSNLELNYICKPAKIDLGLNTNLNMNENSVNEIITNTAQYLKAVLSDENYKLYLNENIIKE